MKPDQAAELNAVRRLALRACCTTRLIPAAMARVSGSASFSILMSPSDRSCGKRNERRDHPVLGILASRQPCRDADAVGFRTILAHFALALEPRDRNAYSDDSP